MLIGYIDPSIVTYATQAIVGVFIAVGAVVGIYFRKAKKKVNKKLGIDENKNKEVESDDIFEEEVKEEKPNKEEKKASPKKEEKKESTSSKPKTNNRSKKKK